MNELAMPFTTTLRNLTTVMCTALLSACASNPPVTSIRTAEYVDLEQFAGQWYVIASIPTFLERRAYNAVEIYEPPVDGLVKTTFRFNQDALDGEQKEYHPKGFVQPGTGNAIWGMQFVWPVKAEYRICYVDETYETTIIGRSKRDYVWIMARTPEIDAAEYDRLLNIVAKEGYDLSKIRQVPHGK